MTKIRTIQATVPSGKAENRLRILDTTLFYTQASGGVRTYIDGKRQALLRRGDTSHKVVMPGSGVLFDGDFVSLPAMPSAVGAGLSVSRCVWVCGAASSPACSRT